MNKQYYDQTLYKVERLEQFQPHCVIIETDNGEEPKHFSSPQARDAYLELQEQIKKEKELESKIIRG